MSPIATLDIGGVRRLALARAGLLNPSWTSLPAKAGRAPRDAALQHIRRTGYLQLDSVSVTGARSHGIVLASRLVGLDRALPEALLTPGGGLVEYWGHEASWMPQALYPALGWRRQRYRTHPWWGDLIDQNRDKVDALLKRISDHGPVRVADLDGRGGQGWWRPKLSKKIAEALWSSGDLAIRERKNFIRLYDLAERVIPDRYRRDMPYPEAVRVLMRKALDGHGWASIRTLASTWRLRDRPAIKRALAELTDAGEVVPCTLHTHPTQKPRPGWIRPADLELAARLRRARPRAEKGVLLSPFDPVLWDRDRVQRLFGFALKLEIYTPAPKRRWGYYCLPVLAGDQLVGRVDLKAHRKQGRLEVKARHLEDGVPASASVATDVALTRFAEAVSLAL
ncbi:MAG: crosslink repair DNA glycosylase YcaQ family protein [Myxococcota bacterium]